MHIELVPNSGYHLFFVPLAVLDDSPQTRWETIYRYADGETRRWLAAGDTDPDFYTLIARVAGKNNRPWRIHEPWLRYRIGRRDAAGHAHPPLAGLWLAFETNLGTADRRGLTVGVTRDITPEDREHCRKTKAAVPKVYCAETVNDLDPLHATDLRDDLRTILETVFREETGEPCTLCCGALPELSCSWITEAGDPVFVDLVIDFGNTRSVVLAVESMDAVRTQGLYAGIKPIPFDDDEDRPWDKPAEYNGLVDSCFVLRTPPFRKLEPEERVQIPVCEIRRETVHVTRDLPDDSLIGRLLRRTKTVTVEEQTVTPVLTEIITKRPHRFVRLAHALIGPAVTAALNDPKNAKAVTDGASVLQSSPKQYYWDRDPYGSGGNAYWNMLDLPYDSVDTGFRPLQGEELEFMPLDGSCWPLGSPPQTAPPGHRLSTANIGKKAVYPRSDTMTWMALAILETAYRHINAGHTERAHIRKQLGGIFLTYPAGWTQDEKNAFHEKWLKARNIFALTHLDLQAPRTPDILPEISLEIDEAVASQLPYVFSEISHAAPDPASGETRTKKASTLWLELVGKRVDIDGVPQPVVRIMTLDIGGGTSDISILRYREQNRNPNAPDIALDATLLYSDSSSVAGDHIMREIIEAVLLPALIPDLDELTRRWEHDTSLSATCRKQLILRQVLIPIARFWLAQLASEALHPFENPDNAHRPYAPADMGIPKDAWDTLTRTLGLEIDVTTPIPVSEDALNRCVDSALTHTDDGFLNAIAATAAGFDADILVVCGKVSEIPRLRELLTRYLPLDPSRIVFYKNYRPGNWYPAPFLRAGAITDPKTATAVGAALFRAFNRSLIPGWTLTHTVSTDFSCSNCWRFFPTGKILFDREDPAGTQKDIGPVAINTQIGRSQFRNAFRPEPVYRIRWKNQTDFRNTPGTVTKLVLKRVTNRQERTDRLEIVAAEATRGPNRTPVQTDEIELALYPVPTAVNWQDDCRFRFHAR